MPQCLGTGKEGMEPERHREDEIANRRARGWRQGQWPGDHVGWSRLRRFACISKVEWSDDGGTTWRPADLDPAISQFGWRSWNSPWRPSRAGQFTLMARATDESGSAQNDRATN